MTMDLPEQEAGRAQLDVWRRDLEANAYDADPFFRRVLDRLLGDQLRDFAPHLRAVAADAARLPALLEVASRDEHLPVMRRHDALGRPVEEVTFPAETREAGRIFWRSGVLSELAQPGREVRTGAIAYLLDQAGEAGHACPVACTAGAIKLLQRVGSDAQRGRWLPCLLERDFDRRVHAAQFVTEVQGGSDVGANACIAAPVPDRPGRFRISGEKWFCSVADAGLFVVSARPLGAPPGTRGLGLFLVPRTIDGKPNGFALRRLKWKLGTRTMATAEIDFDGALGEAVGPLEDGFRNLVGIVLDTSRVHNALAACGLMRGAWTVARAYAGRRGAFGSPIAEFPAVQERLARIRLRGMAALAATFRVLDASDRLERGEADAELEPARRIDVMLGKYSTSRAATSCARDAIEVLGGNGTIEDFSPLPRLYRDAIVVESWEGTHNTLCAQVLRDFTVRGMHRPWLARLEAEVNALGEADAGTARTLMGDLARRVERLVASEPARAAADVRHVADRACRLTDWLALATQRRWEEAQGLDTDTGNALELYRLAIVERRDPLDTPALTELHRRLATGER